MATYATPLATVESEYYWGVTEMFRYIKLARTGDGCTTLTLLHTFHLKGPPPFNGSKALLPQWVWPQ